MKAASRPPLPRLLVALALTGIGSCTGAISDPTGDEAAGGGRPADPGATGRPDPNAPPSPDTGLRRLTRTEYSNTIRDLLGVTSQPGNALDPDAISAGGFDNDASLLNLSFAVEKYDDVGADVVETALRARSASRKKLVACDLAAAGCARSVVSTFARRAWRRPVSPEEVNDLMTSLDFARTQADGVEEGVKLAFRIALLSPSFLYRIEDGTADAAGLHPVTPHELATRMSYFVWASMPDDRLFAAAEAAGDANLGKPAVFLAELGRMLDDPRADALVGNFAAQWLDTRVLAEVAPDPKVFRAFADKSPELRKALADESLAFFRAFLQGAEDATDMLDTNFTFANDRLARYYGLPPLTGAQMRRVQVGGETHRFGLLSQAGILTATSKATRTSPVKRGKWVLSRLLCTPPSPPPANVPALPETPQVANLPLRQRLAMHATMPQCAGCHASMDAIGFALEHYDGIGLWRNAYPSGAIDATGQVAFPDGSSVTFDGAQDLSRKLKQTPHFTRCLSKTMFGYAQGRDPLAPGDRAAIEGLAAEAVRQGGRIRDLVTLIASSPAFRFRGGVK